MIPVKYKFLPSIGYATECYYNVPEELEPNFHLMSFDEQDKYRHEKSANDLPSNLACRPIVGEIILSANDLFSVVIRKIRHIEEDGHPCLLLDVF